MTARILPFPAPYDDLGPDATELAAELHDAYADLNALHDERADLDERIACATARVRNLSRRWAAALENQGGCRHA